MLAGGGFVIPAGAGVEDVKKMLAKHAALDSPSLHIDDLLSRAKPFGLLDEGPFARASFGKIELMEILLHCEPLKVGVAQRFIRKNLPPATADTATAMCLPNQIAKEVMRQQLLAEGADHAMGMCHACHGSGISTLQKATAGESSAGALEDKQQQSCAPDAKPKGKSRIAHLAKAFTPPTGCSVDSMSDDKNEWSLSLQVPSGSVQQVAIVFGSIYPIQAPTSIKFLTAMSHPELTDGHYRFATWKPLKPGALIQFLIDLVSAPAPDGGDLQANWRPQINAILADATLNKQQKVMAVNKISECSQQDKQKGIQAAMVGKPALDEPAGAATAAAAAGSDSPPAAKAQAKKQGAGTACAVCQGVGWVCSWLSQLQADQQMEDQMQRQQLQQQYQQAVDALRMEQMQVMISIRKQREREDARREHILALEELWKKYASWMQSGRTEADTDCAVCGSSGEYGISPACEHFFCAGCAKQSLDAILNGAQFPMVCPQCRAEAGGKVPPDGKGAIDGPALDFLQGRGIVDTPLCFRLLAQQANALDEESGPPTFQCHGCGAFLFGRHDSYVRWLGGLFDFDEPGRYQYRREQEDMTALEDAVWLGQCPSCASCYCTECEQPAGVKGEDGCKDPHLCACLKVRLQVVAFLTSTLTLNFAPGGAR
jgi:hypothetical protein